MNIYESNNITVSDIEITIEKFEESSSVSKPSARVILNKFNKREIKDEYFDLPEFITHEDIVIKTEDQENELSNSKECQNKVKFSLTRHVKTEPLIADSEEEESLSTFKKSEYNEKTIKEEYFIESKIIVQKELDIKDEDDREDQFTAKCEENKTEKDERKYHCDKCSYKTKTKCKLIRHIRIHDKINVPKYSCKLCPYQTIYNTNLKRHLQTHNCIGLLCILCHKSFKHKLNLDAHYVSRHPDRSDEWRRMITSKINDCPKCLYKTVNLRAFKKHLATHGIPTNQTEFKCNTCEYKSISKNNLNDHLRLHVGQLPFVCIECNKRFNIKSQLDGHILSRHSENEKMISSVTSKVHKCDRCDYKTVFNTNMKNHLKICI